MEEMLTLEKEVKNIVKSKPGLSHGAYMGMIMAKFQGKVDGKKVMEIIPCLKPFVMGRKNTYIPTRN